MKYAPKWIKRRCRRWSITCVSPKHIPIWLSGKHQEISKRHCHTWFYSNEILTFLGEAASFCKSRATNRDSIWMQFSYWGLYLKINVNLIFSWRWLRTMLWAEASPTCHAIIDYFLTGLLSEVIKVEIKLAEWKYSCMIFENATNKCHHYFLDALNDWKYQQSYKSFLVEIATDAIAS